ncbi:MAG TPA: peptide deformylase [Legionellales bacterium]|jgi:peptide deformylase|nr:peptide deformylase [Legionellales bacterium]
MALLKILYLPDERLRKISTPVTEFNDELQTLIEDMFETMYEANGVGLAAPQIGVNIRLSVVDVSPEKNERQVFVNPEIIQAEGKEKFKEGCLSVPGAMEIVERSKNIKVKALDRHGKPFEIECDGLLAECLQHEIDHLNGKLFLDLLSPIKKERARKDLEKYLKSHK